VSRLPLARAGWGLMTLVLVGSLVFELAKHGTGWWQVILLALGPALALLVGAAPGLTHGQFHPRAVPLYNLVHHPLAPILLAAVAAVDWVGLEWFIGALAWAVHIGLGHAPEPPLHIVAQGRPSLRGSAGEPHSAHATSRQAASFRQPAPTWNTRVGWRVLPDQRDARAAN
jgi:hypothetical protein